ncbi:hypothetical protein SDC9_187706 [bioreactor metagenome]|uniref:Uncharacterized protein n=1 Tax=bioreactor metagenome TaxID=1076179 RepID=A0A645HMX1_9ZZZZ
MSGVETHRVIGVFPDDVIPPAVCPGEIGVDFKGAVPLRRVSADDADRLFRTVIPEVLDAGFEPGVFREEVGAPGRRKDSEGGEQRNCAAEYHHSVSHAMSSTRNTDGCAVTGP